MKYFEAHPAEPLSRLSRRQNLAKIGRELAEWLGEPESAVLAELNRLGGGVA